MSKKSAPSITSESGEWGPEDASVQRNWEPTTEQTIYSPKEIFLYHVRNGSIENALFLMEEQRVKREDVADSEEYKKAVQKGFIRIVKERSVHEMINVRDKLGQGIDLTEIPEYTAEIQALFFRLLDQGADFEISLLHDEFARDIDFRAHPNYVSALRSYCLKFNAKTMQYIQGENVSPEEPYHEKWNSGNVSFSLMVDFESILIYTEDYFQQRLLEELEKMGSPTGDIAELREENQAKFQAFSANLYAELTAKINQMASPELIRAYLAQDASNGSSEFLVSAA